MSLKLIAINCVLLAIIVGEVQSAVTTVRPYKFGFTIDEQQHRAEKRDERGIVMGEFGFITADGIYHVTVYATDEDGKFRIISMKSYPYAGPLAVPAITTTTSTSTTTKATPLQASLPKYNFNTEACSGCFLKKTPVPTPVPKTEIRTLSQPLPPSAETDDFPGKLAANLPQGQQQTDRGLNVQLPFRASIAQTIDVATRLGGGLPSTQTQYNTKQTTPKQQQRIDQGIELAMTTYTHTKAEVTGHVKSQTQHKSEANGASRRTMVDYAVGVSHPTNGLPDAFNYVSKEHQQQTTLSPLHIQLNANAVKDAGKYIDNGAVSSLVDLKDQSNIKPASKAANQVPIFAVQSNAFAPGKVVGHLHEPLASHTSPVLSPHPLSVSAAAQNPKHNANPVHQAQAHAQQHQPHTQLTQSSNQQQNQRLNKPSSSGVAAPALTGTVGANTQTAAKTPITSAVTATRIGSPLSGGSPANVGGSRLGGGNSLGGTKPGAGTNGGPSSGGSPVGGANGNHLGGGGSAGGNRPTSGISAGSGGSRGASATISNETGDLYKFKYLLDYNGHEETGSRNGDKQGNYFAIGEDSVLRTIEYIANEFGYQPHVSWQKLDTKDAQALPEENSLKHYEFKWFNKAE
ncbi:uncharacterized protein Dwil_GK16925 [Drosophila willistoni]|uniref:Protein lethal(3)malignant blood neoplasm 1 n=1 Tax=Drosophila willistoni TaxID=7260 RepID=B4MKZ4_DROWI|nr:uncharacterized protein Dwil_GK16925 [Drosophila willistoni]